MAAALPKVTEYIKNLGKSVAYSTIDYMKETTPKASDFMETNEDLFKEIYAGIKDIKGTTKKAVNAIKSSKVYDAVDVGRKAIFEDIKTGKFYNKDRIEQMELKAMGNEDLIAGGGDEWDFNFGDVNDDWNFDDDDWDENDSHADTKAIVKSNSVLSKKIGTAIDESIQANADITFKSSAMVADTVKSSTNLLYSQGERIYGSMNAGLAGIREDLAKVSSFITNGGLQTHLNNTTTFYENTTKSLNEMNALMKEFLEMQRNIYKKEQKMSESSAYSNVVGSEGMPDLKEYGKNIKKNLKNILGPEFEMIFGNAMGKDSNLLLAFVGAPLRFIPDMVVKMVIPKMVKDSIETFDDALGAVFTNFVAKMNKAKDSDNPVLSFLGKLLGLNIKNKTSINPSKYEKGPVPFDGITRKSIIEVIPGYLARIEAALTRQNERVYDYEYGKWTDISEIEKNFKSRRNFNIRNSMSDQLEEINNYLAEMRKVNQEEAKRTEAKFNTIINKIYEDGIFEPYRKRRSFGDDKDDYQDPYDYYGSGTLTEDEFNTFTRLFLKNKKAAKHLSENIIDAKDSYSYMLEQAENGINPFNLLYNGAYKNLDIKSNKLGSFATTGLINSETDKYHRTIFDYLRGIYAELREIRRGSGIPTGKGRKKAVRYPMSSNPLADLETEFDKELAGASTTTATDAQSSIFGSIDAFNDNYMLKEEIEKMHKQQEEDEKKNKYKENGFFGEMFKANTLSEKFKVAQAYLAELLKKPSDKIAEIVGKADQRIFEMIFGKEDQRSIFEKYGKNVNSLLDYILYRLQETFDAFSDWMHKTFDPIKERIKKTHIYQKGKDFLTDVGYSLKDKFSTAKETVSRAIGRTYGSAYDRVMYDMKAPVYNGIRMDTKFIRDFQNGQISDEEYEKILNDIYENPQYAANGKFITKRGLAVVSPGEVVIPATFDKRGQNKQLRKEKSFAKRFGLDKLNFFAGGNASTDTDSSTGFAESIDINAKDKPIVEKTYKKVIKEISPNAPDIVASGLIGGGVSLITGMVGGPLLGAAAGAGISIVKNSQTVQRYLFGEDIAGEDGKTYHRGGLISKDTQDKFKKYFPDVRDFGIAGGIAGLFTPLGIVGGMMAGGAIGFLKNNNSFMDYLYGPVNSETGERDGGLISKKFRDMVKKGAPNMAVGAIGGALFGPFGLLGNAALGAGIGLVTSTNKFHEFIFGKDDGHGKKVGGLVQAFKKAVLDPLALFTANTIKDLKDFGQRHILDPLKNFISPLGQMIKNAITDISDAIKDKTSAMLENSIGQPIKDFLQHSVFKHVTGFIKKIVSIPLTLAKGVVSAPMHTLGWIGNNIRGSQIKKGTATNMTAAERLNWRKSHKVRTLMGDSTKTIDTMLANNDTATLKAMQDQVKLYLDARRTYGEKAGKLAGEIGQKVSDFFNERFLDDSTGRTLYNVIGYKNIKKLTVACSEGDIEKVKDLLSHGKFKEFMTTEQISDLITMLTPMLSTMRKYRESAANVKKNDKRFLTKINKLTNGAIGNVTGARRLLRNLNKEIDTREAAEAKVKAEETNKNKETTLDTVNHTMIRKADAMITALNDINESIRELDPTYKANKRPSNVTPPTGEARKAAGSSGIGPRSMKAVSLNQNENSTSTNANGNSTIYGKPSSTAVGNIKLGAHTERLNDNSIAIVSNATGKPISGSPNSGQYTQEQKEKEKDKKTRKSFFDKFKESFVGRMFTGAIGTVSSLIGKVVKTVFIGATGVALAGHFSELWKTKLWPGIKNTVGPWLMGTRNEDGVLEGGLRGLIFGNKNVESGKYEGGLIPGVANALSNLFSPVINLGKTIYESIKDKGISGLLDPVMDWYVSGIDKFATNVVTPIVRALVKTAPDLLVAIGKGIAQGFKDLLSGKGEDTGYIVENEDGSKSLSNNSGNTHVNLNTVNQSNSISNKLGLSENTSNTFATDNNGNYIFANTDSGEYATKIYDDAGKAHYIYEDGSEETDRSKLELVKQTTYGRNASNKTTKGSFISGLTNNLIKGLTGYGSTKAITYSANSIASSASKVVSPAGGIFSRLKNGISAVGKGLHNVTVGAGDLSRKVGEKIRNYSISSAADDLVANTTGGASDNVALRFVDKVDDVAKATVSTADDAATWLSKSKKGITEFFTKLGENSTVKRCFATVGKILGTSVDDILVSKGFKTIGEQFAKKAGDNVVKSSLKSLASALSAIPIATIILAAGYFVSGYSNAHTIFGIAKDIDIPIHYNIIAGLVNAVKNALPGIGIILAFIDTSTIVDIFVDHLLPIFGWDDSSLKEMREESQKVLDDYNSNPNNAEKQVTSIEEYNKKDSIGTKIKKLLKRTTNSIFGNNNSITSSTKTSTINYNRVAYGNGRNSGSSRGHMYQKAADIANMRFGNSTIGESGCGPVTAVNMINRLSGRGLDVATAANYAESGGYIDSTGGTTTDYIRDILRDSGYNSMETYNRDTISKSLKNGIPAVLLGNSGTTSTSSPFGASDHYINAYGMDKRGNVITEDPDLPGGMRKYSLGKLMKDTKAGILTGRSRIRSKFRNISGKRRLSGREREVTVSDVARVAYQLIFNGESGGSYGAVNKNDNGAMSVGRIQWHGERAHNILKKICIAMGNNPGISQSLWNEICSNKSFAHRIAGSNEVEDLKKLLDSDTGHEIQDEQALLDIENYVTSAKNAGMTDNAAIAYYCDNYNIGPSAAITIRQAATSIAGSASKITLDIIHEATRTNATLGQNSQYWTRKQKAYEFLKNYGTIGNGTSTISVSEISNMVSVDTNQTSGLLSQITALGTSIMRAAYGDLYDAMFGNSSSDANVVNVTPGTVSGKQQALVNQMRSVQGKLHYSLDADKQNPDNGTGSCASTVSWAYRKVLGDEDNSFNTNPMSAGATAQAKTDSRFSVVEMGGIDINGNGTGHADTSKLMPGDLLYYRRNNKNGYYNIGHVEMYAGNDERLGHGGPNWNDMGPTVDKMSWDDKNFVMAKRYNGFINSSNLSAQGRSVSNNAQIASMNYINEVNRRASGKSRYSGNAYEGVSYETFLNTIVNILMTIANNTAALDQILNILSTNGIKIDRTSIQAVSGSSRDAKAKIRGIVDSANRAAGRARTGNAVDRAGELIDNESTAYIVQVMEALAEQ